MKRVIGHNVKVTTDNTGGFISVDWACPYCKQFNAGFYFSSNAMALQNDFETDQICSSCGKEVTIECRNSQELFH